MSLNLNDLMTRGLVNDEETGLATNSLLTWGVWSWPFGPFPNVVLHPPFNVPSSRERGFTVGTVAELGFHVRTVTE
jgi:hypothetical protein